MFTRAYDRFYSWNFSWDLPHAHCLQDVSRASARISFCPPCSTKFTVNDYYFVYKCIEIITMKYLLMLIIFLDCIGESNYAGCSCAYILGNGAWLHHIPVTFFMPIQGLVINIRFQRKLPLLLRYYIIIYCIILFIKIIIGCISTGFHWNMFF